MNCVTLPWPGLHRLLPWPFLCFLWKFISCCLRFVRVGSQDFKQVVNSSSSDSSRAASLHQSSWLASWFQASTPFIPAPLPALFKLPLLMFIIFLTRCHWWAISVFLFSLVIFHHTMLLSSLNASCNQGHTHKMLIQVAVIDSRYRNDWLGWLFLQLFSALGYCQVWQQHLISIGSWFITSVENWEESDALMVTDATCQAETFKSQPTLAHL